MTTRKNFAVQCIWVGSDESHFNVSVIVVRDKVTKQ